jgi:hypothetical protein
MAIAVHPSDIKMVVDNVYPSKVFSTPNPDWSNFLTYLADSVYYHRYQSWSFFQEMCMIDPVGEGDCGYIALMLFGMFMRKMNAKNKTNSKKGVQVPKSVKSMKVFLLKHLKNNLEYFKTSKTLLLTNRGLNFTDDQWNDQVTNFALERQLLEDLDEENAAKKDGMFNLDKEPTEDEERPWLDPRHLEVFALATKSKIVLLTYLANPHTQSRDGKWFTCLDIDWRDPKTAEYTQTQRDTSRVKFSEGIPEFGEDYDWHNTVVIMLTPGSSATSGDWVIFDTAPRHFTVWLPKKFFDEWE